LILFYELLSCCRILACHDTGSSASSLGEQPESAMEGKPGETAATSSTSSEPKGRSTPTAVEPPPSSSTAGTGTPFVQLQDAQSIDWLIEICN
jgi:hypothetical protein